MIREHLIKEYLNKFCIKREDGIFYKQEQNNEEEVRVRSEWYINNSITWNENEMIVFYLNLRGSPINLWDKYYTLWDEEQYYRRWENEWYMKPHPANPKKQKV